MVFIVSCVASMLPPLGVQVTCPGKNVEWEEKGSGQLAAGIIIVSDPLPGI